MSKYIRTKDFIAISEIELSGYYYCRMVNNPQLKNIELVIIYNCHFSNGVTGDFYQVPQKLVKEESDTIEELCDEFIATRGHTGDYVHYAKSIFKKETIKDFLEQDFEIYGAIWTKWGLKYVAKLNEYNEEGELELI